MDGSRERHGRPDTDRRNGHRGRRERKKKLGIFDLLGVAVGNMGLRYEDFCDLTPDEFIHIYRAYSNERDERYKDSWERARMTATASLLPYAKKGETMFTLYPFPWDNKRKPEPMSEAPTVSKEDALQRFEEVLEKVEKG